MLNLTAAYFLGFAFLFHSCFNYSTSLSNHNVCWKYLALTLLFLVVITVIFLIILLVMAVGQIIHCRLTWGERLLATHVKVLP
jgi:hypothetical protein